MKEGKRRKVENKPGNKLLCFMTNKQTGRLEGHMP